MSPDLTQTARCRCGWTGELAECTEREAPDRDDGTIDLLCPDCGYFIGMYGATPDGTL